MSRAESIADSKAFESSANIQDPAVEVSNTSNHSSPSYRKAEAATASASGLPGSLSSRLKATRIVVVVTMTSYGRKCKFFFALELLRPLQDPGFQNRTGTELERSVCWAHCLLFVLEYTLGLHLGGQPGRSKNSGHPRRSRPLQTRRSEGLSGTSTAKLPDNALPPQRQSIDEAIPCNADGHPIRTSLGHLRHPLCLRL
jgi:hypothetical protein